MICDEKRLKTNAKMRLLIESRENGHAGVFQMESEKLRDLLFQKFVSMFDCVVISSNSQQLLERHFDNILSTYSDRTGYEASNTETRVTDFLDGPISVLDAIDLTFLVIDCWALQLKNIDLNCEFCFVIGCDVDSVTLRFHKIRPDESMWLQHNLEDYQEPVGYMII